MKAELPKLDDLAGDMNYKEITITLKKAPHPFAEGALRLAYHALDVSHSKKIVLKESKRLGKRQNSLKRFLVDMECQTVAARLALTYNEECKPEIPIRFAVAKVVHVKEVKSPIYYALEPYIEGTCF
jgi:hypothetical protein